MLLKKVFQLLIITALQISSDELFAQDRKEDGEDIYYLGVNPVAPFTSIRTDLTTLFLPYISQQETGIALFVGKIWNKNYNVETRLSYGSPVTDVNLFQVHSGFNYLFVAQKASQLYVGAFIKIYSMHHTVTKSDEVNGIGYLAIGKRFMWRRLFIDVRVNENVYSIRWSNRPGSKAQSGFHESIYKWKSPYIPYASVGIGYLFR